MSDSDQKLTQNTDSLRQLEETTEKQLESKRVDKEMYNKKTQENSPSSSKGRRKGPNGITYFT